MPRFFALEIILVHLLNGQKNKHRMKDERCECDDGFIL
jgi:hypothetical protein